MRWAGLTGSFRLLPVTTLRAAGETVATRRPTLAVGGIVLFSTVFRLALAWTWDVPWIAPDEMIYGLVGESLWETGQLSIRGISTPYYSLLTPGLVGAPLMLDDRGLGVSLAQALQALAMSLAAVPVYLWARRVVGSGWALVAATLAVLPPALSYGGLLMTEALFYPAVTAALLALARLLETPTLERQGVFLLAVSAAAAIRLQALVLLPAFLLAAGLDAWFARSPARLRRLTPSLVLVGAGTAALVVASITGRGDLLGAYGELGGTTPSSTGLISQLTWHAGAVVVMTLVVPLLASATLFVLAAFKGESDSPRRAFLAVTGAYVPLLVVQVSFFAVDHLDHVGERYLVTSLPPLVLGLVVWIERGAPRPIAAVVPLAAGSVLLVAALPPSRVGTLAAAHDVLTVVPLADVLSGNELRAALAAIVLVAAAAFVFLPTALWRTGAAALGLAFAILSITSANEIQHLAEIEQNRDFGAADPTWIDDAGAGATLLFDTGEQPSTSIARLTFWNRAIRELARLEGVPTQALPQVRVAIRRDGALTDVEGREVTAPWAVLPTTVVVNGSRVTTTPPTDVAPGSTLWRVSEPLRLVSRSGGFLPNGDFRRGTVVVYRCGSGTLEADLLGKDGAPVVARVNGFPNETFELAPGGSRNISVTPVGVAEGSPCLFELESEGLVGSTRIEWVSSGG
jgi:hypothetical protein